MPTLQELQSRLAAFPEADGWLIYDFRGQNPHAGALLGLGHSFLTRRFFVWLPRIGEPALIHHRIEEGSWRRLLVGQQLRWLPYSAYGELEQRLGDLLGGKKAMMEYSPRGFVPAVSAVDGGTLELLHSVGVSVMSSADLLQTFQRWSPADVSAHERAVTALMEAKDLAFAALHRALQRGEAISEYGPQQLIEGHIAACGLRSGHPANVSFGANAADPHYEPSATQSATLERGQCVLIDLWAQEEGRPYADVTWVGYAGIPDPEYLRAFAAVTQARDLALRLLQRGEAQWGWQVDCAAREVLREAGFGEHFAHRLGHSLGVELHGAAVNLDDLETHDTRRLLPGLAVTIEPGVYPGRFGIRSEINVLLCEGGAQLTTPLQRAPFVLGGPQSWEEVRTAAL